MEMSALALSIGYVAGVVGLVTKVPQAVRVWRSHSDQGVNVTMWVLTFVSFCAWLGYGLRMGNYPIILANIGVMTVVAAVLVAIARTRQRNLIRDLLLIAVLVAVVVGLAFVVPVPIVVGYFVAASAVPWLQVRTSSNTLRNGTPSYVSRATLSIRTLGMSLWLVHGFLVGDDAIIVAISITLTATTLTLVLETVSSRRRDQIQLQAT